MVKNNQITENEPEEQPFSQTIQTYFETSKKVTFTGEEEEKKLFKCPHRRRHLIKMPKGVKIQLLCKDSKIIYLLDRPIKITPVSPADCLRCEVPEIENRINCRHLGFEKNFSSGQLLTNFYCGWQKTSLSAPLNNCAVCQKARYIA
jgi:hypothetical protein